LTEPRDSLLKFVCQLDGAGAAQLVSDFGQSAGSAVAAVLGTVFPPFYPRSDWQRRGLAQIESDGWRIPRTRADFLTQLTSRLNDPSDRSDTLAALRQGAWIERARIALRELLPHTLGGAPFVVTAREISWLAETLLEVACAEAREHVSKRLAPPRAADGSPSEFVVLGMGKLGGLELNAGSDIDVCFLYDTDEGFNDSELHEHWSRVARRVVQNMELPTDEGHVWRVDLRLRPEGSRGAIVNSMVASERYYETWGRLWERCALIRARPVAGDMHLGARFMREIATPFVYRREVDPSIVPVLSELLTRSRIELRADAARDLKLGVGGIREVEFFVQALQLIWGGRDRSLRVTGIFPALERLRGAGFVTEREARLLAESYTLLRSVEHRVQWNTGIQTHLLPKDDAALDLLARTLGMPGASKLIVELDRARSIVADAFASLHEGGNFPKSRHIALFALIDRINNPSAADDAYLRESSPPPPPVATQQLPFLTRPMPVPPSEAEEVGVSAELIEHLSILAKRPDGLLGGLTRERYPQLTETVLDAVAQSADPAQAALALRLVFGRINHPAAYFAALSEDERAVRRLVTALASSSFIVDTMVSRLETLDIVMSAGGRVENPRRILARELRAAAADSDNDHYERLEAVVAALRRAKSRLFVEVVIADLSGAIELRTARQTLSDFADASLEQAARQVFDGEPQGLGIVALGKLGAQDLGYGSDLDVIFIYDPALAPEQSESQAFYIRKAQQIIRLVSAAHPAGPGYELDVRLRPSGSQGMLVTSLQAFGLYHGVTSDAFDNKHPAVVSSGAPWERQVLLRARACAGDMAVAGRAVKLASLAAYAKGPPDVQDLHRLRLRMQQELARERAGHFDLKSGYGGLLDIEFATQWLQMLNGEDIRVHTTNTEDALSKLTEAGYLSGEHFQVFRDGYVFLRQLEQRLFVIFGRGSSAFDMESGNWPRLARRMRLQDSPRAPAAELLRTRYRDVTQAVRMAYLGVLGIA
jgi:glutamate-ammonia-ligase adenylyltransferase